MKITMKIFLVIFFCLITASGYTQIAEPVKWDYKVNMLSNCEAELIFTATVDKGWHLYSQKHVNGLPLIFEFTQNSSFKLSGEVIEPNPIKEYDDVMHYDIFYFKGSEVIFKQKIELNSEIPFKITGTITGQVCQYESGMCKPLNQDFSIDLGKCLKKTD